jgi:protein-disulfide isomerase
MIFKKYGIDEKDLLTPISILIGAILISASICWSSGKMPWLGNGSVAVRTQNGQNAGPVAAGNNNDQVVKITERRDAPSVGSGKVEIVEFSDFQCPFCQQFFNNAYKDIKAKYVDTGKVKLTFRHYPLSFHQNAEKAAEAAECANRQGKFWQYHDVLFTKAQGDGTNLDITSLKKYAKDLNLDTNKFTTCLDNGETAEVIKKDIADAGKAGVTGTPTIFIDGKKIVGAQPFANFQQEIENALKK